MKVIREAPVKIGIKTIERAWKSRAKDARLIIPDNGGSGLELIVNAASMTWSRSYKPRGMDARGRRFSTTSIVLGSPATLSPDQARAEASRIRDAVAAGRNPSAERKAAIDAATAQRASTVERAVARYLAVLPRKEKRRKGGRISERWAKEQAAYLGHAIAALRIASTPVEKFDVATVRRLKDGPAYRHRFGAVSRFLSWCVREGLIATNPCASIDREERPVAGGQRERTPTLKELATVWAAVEKASEKVFRDFVQFAICVPARRGEIASLCWEHLDLDARVWDQPGRLTKNRDPHRLWLNEPAMAILTRRREEAGCPKTGLVFPSPRSATVISAFSGIMRALHSAAAGLTPLTLHDFRRSFASTLGQIGEDDESTIDAVLNHRQSGTRSGVLGVYNRSKRFSAQRQALERWGGLVQDALEGRFPEEPKVIPLARRARF
jgi:integrase